MTLGPYSEETHNHIRITELEKRMDLHHLAARESLALAASDLKSRLAAMNEIREAMRDQSARFLTRWAP